AGPGRAIPRPVPAAMAALRVGLGGSGKRLRLEDSDHDIGVRRGAHADPGTPNAHRPILEALIGGEGTIMTPDRQRHESAIERRRVEVHAGRDTTEGDVDAIVEELLLAIEPDELGAHAKTRAVDFLRLDDGVTDIIGACVATSTVDDAHVGREARNAG